MAPAHGAPRRSGAGFAHRYRNGLLFDTEDDEFALLGGLQRDPARRRLGAAARATIEQLFAPATQRAVIGFYPR